MLLEASLGVIESLPKEAFDDHWPTLHLRVDIRERTTLLLRESIHRTENLEPAAALCDRGGNGEEVNETERVVAHVLHGVEGVRPTGGPGTYALRRCHCLPRLVWMKKGQ